MGFYTATEQDFILVFGISTHFFDKFPTSESLSCVMSQKCSSLCI